MAKCVMFALMDRVFKILIPFLGVLLSSCSSVRFSPILTQFKGISPQDLYQFACSPGRNLHAAHGEVWIRVKSNEVSGQFNAQVQAQVPRKLDLQVDHPLKGIVAQVKVRNTSYEIRNFEETPPWVETGSSDWNGLPLDLATSLFLGKIPCPDSHLGAQLRLTSDGDLLLRIQDQEEWIFQFRVWNGQPWADRVTWRSGGRVARSWEIRLDDPETNTGSPLKWEIHSLKGLIKVKWKDRATN